MKKSDFDELWSSRGVTRAEAYNYVAIAIAKEFDAHRATFLASDEAINNLWAWIGQDLGKMDLPQPAYAIYEAFDRGEYAMSGEEYPVTDYTRPLIRKILQDV